MNTDIVLVAIITLAGTIFSSLIASLIANKLTVYRIDQLEKKVEKHNNIVEKTAVLELDLKTAFNRIDENREEIKMLEHIER